MIIKLRFLMGAGTTKLKPMKAAIEQIAVGPIRNGIGAPIDIAKNAPRGPSHNEFKIFLKGKCLKLLSFN